LPNSVEFVAEISVSDSLNHAIYYLMYQLCSEVTEQNSSRSLVSKAGIWRNFRNVLDVLLLYLGTVKNQYLSDYLSENIRQEGHGWLKPTLTFIDIQDRRAGVG
jgi:hypothetical protein